MALARAGSLGATQNEGWWPRPSLAAAWGTGLLSVVARVNPKADPCVRGLCRRDEGQGPSLRNTSELLEVADDTVFTAFARSCKAATVLVECAGEALLPLSVEVQARARRLNAAVPSTLVAVAAVLHRPSLAGLVTACVARCALVAVVAARGVSHVDAAAVDASVIGAGVRVAALLGRARDALLVGALVADGAAVAVRAGVGVGDVGAGAA